MFTVYLSTVPFSHVFCPYYTSTSQLNLPLYSSE